MMPIKFKAVYENKIYEVVELLANSAVIRIGSECVDVSYDNVKLLQEVIAKEIYGFGIWQGDIAEFTIDFEGGNPIRVRDEICKGERTGSWGFKNRMGLLVSRLAPHYGLKIIGNIYENPELI